MDRIKNMFFKRITIYLCCTILLSSNLFMSYQVPVYAETTYGDLIKDAVNIALGAAGIYAVVQSGGTMAPLIIPYIETLAGAGFDVHDYVTQDESAGTTTISADFVNLVLQAYKEYRKENSEKFNGVMAPGSDGYYHYDSLSIKVNNKDFNNSCLYTYTNINTRYPCALISYSGVQLTEGSFSGKYSLLNDMVFYDKDVDEFYFYSGHSSMIPASEKQHLNDFGQTINSLYIFRPHLTQKYDDGRFYETDTQCVCVDTISRQTSSFVIASSSSVPIYESLAALKEGLRTGDFSAAYNYGKPASSGESSNYTGEYTGGDITILTEKLNGISGKLKEIDDTGKSIDEKLKELLDWLIGNGGNTGGNADLTTTNSWLEKIYLKVCQIFDKISETAGGAVDTAGAKIQETLDEILAQIKKIKHWIITDTVFDGVDALTDIASLLKDFLSAPVEVVGSAASSLGETANMLTDKFPFSIPWDMAALVTLLSAEPQAPVFKLPIVIESYGIEEYIEIDMSQFEALSTITRGMLSIIYAYGILSMTTKVIDIGGKK